MRALSLTLESSPTAGLLKTADKTYSLRQKNTSNALILLSVAEQQQDSTKFPEAGLAAIATVHDTIELVAESRDTAPVPAAKGKWHERFGKSR